MCPTVEELPDGWQVKRLGSFCTKIGTGATPRGGSEVYLNSRISHALVRSQHVFDRHFDTAGLAFISDLHAKELRNAEVQSGDVLLNITGDGVTFGRSCIVPDRVLPACVNQHVSIIRPDRRECDPGYLLSVLTHPATKGYIESFNSGGSRRAITKGHIESFEIPLPPLAEQKAIAAVLGALDDKIELNRRMNATLEAMARALFGNWTASHEYEIEERLVQELIDERTMLIGDGYRAKNSELAEDGLPFIRAGNLKADGLDLAGAEVLSAKSVAAAGHKVGKAGDVAFTSKGTVGRITRVSSKTGAFVYSPQVCFWRSMAPERLNPHVLYRWMGSGAFMRQVAAVSTQTDMAPYVSLQDQRRMVVTLPPSTAQNEIAKELGPIDDQIAANADQSRTLATLRDTLLPKLLSGELSVAALESQPEAAQ